MFINRKKKVSVPFPVVHCARPALFDSSDVSAVTA